ncbi:MAG: protein containing DUF556 [Candidatus Syntrophoarchaeum caldarius]|uniref:(5-formylfuran-3-yl)methyl phosphate synthase n=1 Tax=Candidatus Syntropharchaeum caldarium TaxID=1838285 RepID=A0A1F2PBI8_9EURY|nr:MAG: protein containing DUF556 [Candidatus Syntrophoarchaeum caldarius]
MDSEEKFMKLLVSPMNVEEAKSAVAGGADIIDVKNPKEGSLGANFPWVIRDVKGVIDGVPLSATIGDFEFKPGTASLAALGAAYAGAHFIKVGLYGIKTVEEAHEILEAVNKSVKSFDPEKKVVASSYSDYKRLGILSPFELPSIGADVGVDVVMLDTGIKDGRTTFEFLSEDELCGFVSDAHDRGLLVALAGAIRFDDIDAVLRVNPDILGVRGIVCGGDRKSVIRKELVQDLKDRLEA